MKTCTRCGETKAVGEFSRNKRYSDGLWVGGCAICHTTEPGGGGRFHVDHDQDCCPGRRSCGKCVRGLLCAPCNTMVRQIERMRAAVEYLERFNQR